MVPLLYPSRTRIGTLKGTPNTNSLGTQGYFRLAPVQLRAQSCSAHSPGIDAVSSFMTLKGFGVRGLKGSFKGFPLRVLQGF